MSMPAAAPVAFSLVLETAADAARVDALVADAFGPGRFAKTAERLREGNAPVASLSFVAHADGEAIATVRLWPVRIGETPVVFLGPIAVERAWRSEGVGAALVEACCAAARAEGWRAVLLVGDEPYFGRFGFVRAPDVRLPGPVDQRRVLVLDFDAEAASLAGPVSKG
ncbi:N-acetyltransferase [Caulobacter sp. 17J65-9]|uniref:GNAT family N-acetyltransferase n=1 Tax=Caulobacter sp. 17J65-9 TaxID=2709382 RepID=UPI0013CA214A|nr:N-acetyltransferase [Caulobacter sp. 17J65-9]NEX93159.1 N-acetyltransferase [Caulobacter sp. 17J65-9]